MVYRALGFRPSAVSHCIVGHTMDRFFPVKKAVETVTAPDLVAAILFFRCADIFSGDVSSVDTSGTDYSSSSDGQCDASSEESSDAE